MDRSLQVRAIVFVYLATLPLLSAQESSTPNDFTRNQLIVKVNNDVVGTVNSRTGLVTASTVTSWTPYRGFVRIDEETFFRIAGFDREADQSRQFHRTRTIMLGTAILGCGLGFVGMMAPFLSDFDNWSMDLMWLSVGVITVSSVPLFVAVFRPNWATVEIAVSVANEYNLRLRNQ